MNQIQVLDPSFLKRTQDLQTIDHWLSVLNWSNGWHYDLDLIWILTSIREISLPRGSVIIDAGAGLGVAQFILASLGYNIISLDFTHRQTPPLTKNIFTIKEEQEGFAGKTHEYMQFMHYGQKARNTSSFLSIRKFLRALQQPDFIYYLLRSQLRNHVNLSNIVEKFRDHSHFGEIRFVRGEFNHMPLKDNVADLLISVSAFEHNTYEAMPGSVKEFCRVVKPGGSLLVTTSLAKEKDWYFEPSKGWNLTIDSLSTWFEIKNIVPFEYDKSLQAIRESSALAARVPSFYKHNGKNGLPYGKLQEAQYVPVGIRKHIT